MVHGEVAELKNGEPVLCLVYLEENVSTKYYYSSAHRWWRHYVLGFSIRPSINKVVWHDIFLAYLVDEFQILSLSWLFIFIKSFAVISMSAQQHSILT